MVGATIRLDLDRQRAHTGLMDRLNDLREIGCRVPCMDTPTAEWTSDELDEQKYVAQLCQGCAGLPRCRTYITTHPEPTSVYAGLTTADRAPRRGRPKKNQENQ